MGMSQPCRLNRTPEKTPRTTSAAEAKPSRVLTHQVSILAREMSVLPHGASVLSREASVLPHGASVLTHGASVLTRGSSDLTRGASVLTRGASVLTRGQFVLAREMSVLARQGPVRTRQVTVRTQARVCPSLVAQVGRTPADLCFPRAFPHRSPAYRRPVAPGRCIKGTSSFNRRPRPLPRHPDVLRRILSFRAVLNNTDPSEYVGMTNAGALKNDSTQVSGVPATYSSFGHSDLIRHSGFVIRASAGVAEKRIVSRIRR